MTLTPIVQIVVFAAFAGIAVAGALGMTTTMSMFRSGIFLMASFIGVGGLFILLSADLLAWLQIMMYIGGMLVMILFMILFSHDPGGRMMAQMPEMAPLERWFSRGLAEPPKRSEHGSGHERHAMAMDMSDMSMTTPIKRPAVVIAGVFTAMMCGLILSRAPWPIASTLPNEDSPAMIGDLLMGKYMLAFEGAGVLILLGIFAAVFLSRPGQRPDAPDREALSAAVDAPPAPIDGSITDEHQPEHHERHHE